MLALSQVALRRGRQLLFENASLQVHRGQRLDVIGRNGCGKSSLFALIRCELETDQGEVTLPRGCVIASGDFLKNGFDFGTEAFVFASIEYAE